MQCHCFLNVPSQANMTCHCLNITSELTLTFLTNVTVNNAWVSCVADTCDVTTYQGFSYRLLAVEGTHRGGGKRLD